MYALYVEAYGAQGGYSSGYEGGLGAMMSGQIEVTPGQQLQILAGQKAPDVNGASGGGGGSYVVTSDGIPLMIAGGGSGATSYSNGKPGLIAPPFTSIA